MTGRFLLLFSARFFCDDLYNILQSSPICPFFPPDSSNNTLSVLVQPSPMTISINIITKVMRESITKIKMESFGILLGFIGKRN
jgi:hypothetical protein